MSELVWKPTPKQELFLSRGEFEAFYGGSAGPGKTDALVMGALRYAHIPTYRGLLLRRTFPRLTEILERTREYYPLAYPGAEYISTEHKWKFPSGATVQLGHMENESDRYNYRGMEYQYVAFDELTEFTLQQYLFLFSRIRSSRESGIRLMIRSASNPGDAGHAWVKERFITNTEPGRTYIDPTTGLDRIYIPGMMEDNPFLWEKDPSYELRLQQLPKIDYQRLRYGIWDAFEGQVFAELNQDVHGYDPKGFEIPREWERFRTFDWGYSKPASVGWWAVDYDGMMYRYREWYVAKKDESNHVWVGMRMSPTEIARGIREIEKGEKVRPGPADPSIWHKRPTKEKPGGPSVAEEMAKEGIFFLPGDNDRILGKQQFHSRLRLNEAGEPMIKVSLDCEHWWRTIPELREDPNRPEDVDTDSEDHSYDESRYMCMFRPLRPQLPKKTFPAGSFMDERRRYMRAKQYAERYGVSVVTAYERIK